VRTIAALLLVLALSACSSSPTIEALDPPRELTEYEAEWEIKGLWARQLGQGVDRQFLRLPPLLDGERLFLTNRRGSLAAYDVADGSRIWRVELERAVKAGPGDGGPLLLLGGDAEVFAVEKEDGSVRWRATVSSEVLAPPLAAGKVIVVRTVDGMLHGLSRQDGRQLWRYQQQVPLLSLRGISPPVVADGGLVVAGFANGRLAAVDLDDGRPAWESAVATPSGRTELERLVDVDAELVVARGVVFAVSFRGRLAALTLDSGRLLWSREFSSYTGLRFDGKHLYLTDEKGDVWAISPTNGATLWKQDALHGRQIGMPALQGDALVVGDFEGYLHWLHREDGRLLGRARVEDAAHYFPVDERLWEHHYIEDRAILSPPRVVGERVYAVDKRGVLNAFRAVPPEKE